MGKIAIIAALVAAAAVPAHAAPIDVTLSVTIGEPVAAVPVAGPCALSVADGSDGFAVLDKAVTAGCIDSYTATGSESDPFGRFLVCVNEVCDPTGDGTALYWRFGVNGAGASVGLDAFSADDGDTLSVSFTTWLGCLVDTSVC